MNVGFTTSYLFYITKRLYFKFILTSSLEKGATMDPMRATVEHEPRAALRTTVGKSSFVYRYSSPNEAVTQNLPLRARHVVNHSISKNMGKVSVHVCRYQVHTRCNGTRTSRFLCTPSFSIWIYLEYPHSKVPWKQQFVKLTVKCLYFTYPFPFLSLALAASVLSAHLTDHPTQSKILSGTAVFFLRNCTAFFSCKKLF